MNNNVINNNECFTVFSYRLAKTLIKNNHKLVDIGLNNKTKGVVFHFVNTPELQEAIKIQREIRSLQNKIN